MKADSIAPSSNPNALMEAFHDALAKTGQACPASNLLSGLPHGEPLSLELLARASARQGLNVRLTDFDSEASWPDSCVLLVELTSGDWAGSFASIRSSSKDPGHVVASLHREGQSESVSCRLSELKPHAAPRCLLVSPPHPVSVDSDSHSSHGHFSSWLFSEFWRMRSVYRDVLLATILLNFFVVVSPLFVMNVYDRVVPNQAFETLWALASGVLIVLMFDLAVKLLRQYFVESAGRQIDVVLSSKLFESVMNRRPEGLPASVGAFASQFREFDSIKHFFTAATFSSLVDLPFALLFLLVIYSLGGALVLVPVTAALVIIFYGFLTHFALKHVVTQSQHAAAQKNAALVESLSVLDTLKAFNAEGRAQTRWEQASLISARLGLSSRRLADSIVLVSAFLIQLSMLGLVIAGVYQIADYEMSLGALIACVLLGNRALAPMVQLAQLSAQYFEARSALVALNRLTDSVGEQSPHNHYLRHHEFKGEIELIGLHAAYENNSMVLTDLNLQIKAGEHVALVGKIGSGKSSLIKLLAGMLPPRSGLLKFDGMGVEQLNPAALRAICGYVPQDISLVSGTLRENLALKNRHFSDTELIAVCRQAGLFDWVSDHPMGLDLPIAELGRGLSGGQRQGIAIARALLGNPEIFLFDELTSAMDNQTESQVIESVRELSAGKTMIVSTHRAALLQLVDRVVILDQGRIVADGPKAQVLEALKKGLISTGGRQ